jgi:hypothetical protein
MQKDNLIVPLVGDFAGPKAIRAVARFARDHNSTIHAFYLSNVEEYLFQSDGDWKRFYDNVLRLPTDSTSAFIRYVANEWRFREQTSQTSQIDSTIRIYRAGFIQGYSDVVKLSR